MGICHYVLVMEMITKIIVLVIIVAVFFLPDSVLSAFSLHLSFIDTCIPYLSYLTVEVCSLLLAFGSNVLSYWPLEPMFSLTGLWNQVNLDISL